MRRTVLPGGLRVITEPVPGRARRPSAAGSASARATSPRATRRSHFLEHLLFKGTAGAPRSTSRSRSTRSAASSTRSPPRSTPASTPGCSTPTCRWRSTCSATWSPRRRSAPTTSTPSAASSSKRSRCTTTTRATSCTTVRRGGPRAHPLGRPIGGTPVDDRGDRPRARGRLLPAALPVPSWSSRPPARSTTTCCAGSSSTSSPATGSLDRTPTRCRGGRRGSRRSRAPSEPVVVRAYDRAGQRRARHHGDHVDRRAALRASVLNARPRRRHVQPALPGGPREARPGLLGLLLRHSTSRRGLFGVYAGCLPGKVDQVLALCGPSWRSSPRTASRGGADRGHGPAARRPGAGPGGLRLADDAARQVRAGLRRVLGLDEQLSRIGSVTVDDVQALAADLPAARAPSPSSARSTRTAPSPAPSPDRSVCSPTAALLAECRFRIRFRVRNRHSASKAALREHGHSRPASRLAA